MNLILLIKMIETYNTLIYRFNLKLVESQKNLFKYATESDENMRSPSVYYGGSILSSILIKHYWSTFGIKTFGFK